MAIKVSRIEREFILKTLLESKILSDLLVLDKRFKVQLMAVKPDCLQFSVPEDASLFSEPRKGSLFIAFRGTRVTCSLERLELRNKTLQAAPPEHLYRDLSRNFERIQPELGISVGFLLDGLQFKMDFPTSQEYYEPEAPTLNIKFDAARITNLLRAFREKALSFSSENKIVMFRERKPQSVAERLIALSGRTLLLPLSDVESLALHRNPDTPKLLSDTDIARIFQSDGQDPIQGSIELSRYVDGLYQKKIWHEMYTPVLFKEYVVGYVYLMRSDLQTTQFSANTLDFVQQFARLLSYSLKQNGYFQMIPVRESFDKSELVDISGSGLLFSMPLNGPSLDIYTDLDLQITVGERVLPVRGRVMRRFQDSGRIYIGIKILEISGPDHDFLLQSIYGENPFIAGDGITG